MKYFDNPRTLEQLKSQYRKLALENHPDRGGSTATMQAINAEYDALFERLKNIHSSATGETYTAKTETTETPDEFRNIINSIINLHGLKIELCGSWLWITGNTYQHKETLKSIGFKYSGKKQAWYYHTGEYKKLSRKKFSLNDIRLMWGSAEIEGEYRAELNPA